MGDTTHKVDLNYSRIAERYASFFGRPDVRLRFLRNTLRKHSEGSARLDALTRRFPVLRRRGLDRRVSDLWFYALMFGELNELLPDSRRERRELMEGSSASVGARVFFQCYRMRRALCVPAACVVMGLCAGLFMLAMSATSRIHAFVARRGEVRVVRVAEAAAPSGVGYLPDYKPEKVWLVERKDGEERYSNGGRILRNYETTNHARSYVAPPRGADLTDAAAAGEPRSDVAGIVFHTSESDLLPFNEGNNESIETHTRGLLEYVRRNKSYNYVIDRFGQVYRVVVDEDAANHAGHSVWADRERVYVGLNESFLGVCFETRSDTEGGEQLTEAQMIAGRLLTQVLRSRYQIDDANCVTHGLVSVNPDNMLICYHHDWVRGFPFAAFGLSDKYAVEPAAVSDFGFTYDESVEAAIGGAVWSGAEQARREFARRAESRGVEMDALRARMHERYRRQMDLSRRHRAATPAGAGGSGPSGTSPAPTTRPPDAGPTH
jgi:hypothetical protein